MAGLTAASHNEGRPVSGASQLAAIAWLRGRLFVNSFRRKGGKSETIASLLLFCFFAVFGIGPIIGAGIASYLIVARNEYGYLPWMLWIVFLVWTTFTISTKAAAPAFDLGILLRFPLRFRTYFLIRLVFGLLDVPTVVCSLSLLAAAIGVGIARSSFFAAALLSFLLFDLTVIFFFRMVFLWLDRWFAQRKTREILMGCFFVLMIGFQFLNITLNSGAQGRHSKKLIRDPVAAARHEQRMTRLRHGVEAAEPVLRLLPPGLAASSFTLYAAGERARVVPPIAGLCAFALTFLTLFGRRLRGEFRGENFNEAPSADRLGTLGLAAEHRPSPGALPSTLPATVSRSLLTPTIRACIGKEIVYLRRSGPLLLQLVTPIFMVFIFVTRTGFAQRPTEWVLPISIAYILLGLTAGMYNILGTDGPGVQLYFLAPVRLRQVVIAKNFVSLGIIAAEILIASAIVLSTLPAPPLPTLCAVYIWAALAVAVNLTMGNIRSIYAPRQIDLGKFRQGRPGQLNALMGLGVLIVCLALGAGVLYLADHVQQPWLAAPILGFFAAAAIAFYRMNLNHLTRIAEERREIIGAELCRT